MTGHPPAVDHLDEPLGRFALPTGNHRVLRRSWYTALPFRLHSVHSVSTVGAPSRPLLVGSQARTMDRVLSQRTFDGGPLVGLVPGRVREVRWTFRVGRSQTWGWRVWSRPNGMSLPFWLDCCCLEIVKNEVYKP